MARKILVIEDNREIADLVALHLRDMGMGKIDVRHLVYHLSAAALMLFLTVKMVEARKWK